jgi:hypothetical protein
MSPGVFLRWVEGFEPTNVYQAALFFFARGVALPPRANNKDGRTQSSKLQSSFIARWIRLRFQARRERQRFLHLRDHLRAGGLQTASRYPPAYPPDSQWILISSTGPNYNGARKELNLCHFVNNT